MAPTPAAGGSRGPGRRPRAHAAHTRFTTAHAVTAVAVAGLLYAVGSVRHWDFGLLGSVGFGDLMGDFGLSAAAAAAAVSCFVHAIRSAGRIAVAWMLFGLSVSVAAAGNGVWGFYELVLRRSPPLPSAADWIFLLFAPLAIGAILVLHGGPGGWRAWTRMLLDGCLIAGSLFTVGWEVALQGAAAGAAGSPLRVAFALAYPTFDIFLVALLVVLRPRVPGGERAALAGAVVGLSVVVVCDALWTIPPIHDSYHSGELLDAGWFTGYLLLACAPWLRTRSHTIERPVPQPPIVGWTRRHLPGILAVAGALAPYAAAMACLTMVGVEGFTGDRQIDPVILSVAGFVLIALIVRQALTLLDNVALARELAAREDYFRTLALHDDLTGLANRALFTDRMEHAMAQRDPKHEPVAALFLDLDGFKAVNDSAGHNAGDELLTEAAERLRRALRVGDTVARFGGDEFAVLLEHHTTPRIASDIAARLLDVLSAPYELHGRTFSVSASIGVAFAGPDLTAAEVLRHADLAMYAAKASGKSRVSVYDEATWPGAAVPTI